MRLHHRILAAASGVVLIACTALLALSLVAWVVTRRTALLVVCEAPFREFAVRDGSAYWRSEVRGSYTPGLRVSVFMGRRWSPPEQAPTPSDGWLGFVSRSIRLPNQPIAGYLRGPVDSRLTIVPLWFVLALLSMPLAIRTARSVVPWRKSTPAARAAPAGRRRRSGDAPTRIATCLLVVCVAGWLLTTFWQEGSVQWTGSGRTVAIRSGARQGSVEVWSGPSLPTGPEGYADTGWQITWEWFSWPARVRETFPPESHVFPWFSVIDLGEARPPGRLVVSAPPGAAARRATVGHRWEIPYWFLVAAAAVRPLVRLRARLWPGLRHSLVLRLFLLDAGLFAGLARMSRRPAGHCPQCGYDLRASPERCPECGRPVRGRVS